MVDLSHASWVFVLRRPEFQVLRAVVIANSVLVVDAFVGFECTPQDLFHHEAVLHDPGSPHFL